jgi:transposase
MLTLRLPCSDSVLLFFAIFLSRFFAIMTIQDYQYEYVLLIFPKVKSLSQNRGMTTDKKTDARKLDHATLEVMRLRAIEATKAGMKATDLALAYGVHRRTVFRWLADYYKGGEQALKAKPIPGRPPKLDEPQMQSLAQAVTDQTPLQHGFEVGLWTLSILRELIRRQFGHTMSLSSVSRVMSLLGITVQKPLYRAWQQDPERVRKWETEEFPAIKKQAREQGATVFFADEAGIRSDYHTGTTWAPAGQTPVVTATGRRFSLNMLSAVSPKGEFRFMLHDCTVTAPVFKTFLQRLMVGATNPVFVVVDGHPVHKSALVRQYIESQAGNLQLVFLPPYSLQRNPDEQVWAHVKRRVSSQFVESKDEMKRLALGALRRIQKLPKLVRSFFGHNECLYARM